MQADTKVTRRINFTKGAIAALESPADGRVYVYDTKTPGLTLCLTAAGSRTFYWYRKVDGRPERIPLGAWPGMTVEQAREAAERQNGDRAEGVNPNDARRAITGAPTLQQAFDKFIDLPTRTKAKRPKSEKTKKDYRLQFDAYLAGWKDRRLSSIKRNEVEKLHNDLSKSSGFYTANRVLALVKAIYNTAIDQGDYNANPALRLRPFEEHSRDRYLQAEELPKFWKELEAEPSEKVRDAIKLLLFTGQRKANVLSMRWADVNLEQKLWRIPQTKTGKHEVPLSDAVVEILQRRLVSRLADGPVDPENKNQRLPSDYVLPGLHGHGHLKDPMRAWRDILERAGIENLRIHDLRRSMGSWQTNQGASRPIVGKLLGHKREETTAIYGRVGMEPVRESLEAATAAIMKAGQPVQKKRTRKKAS